MLSLGVPLYDDLPTKLPVIPAAIETDVAITPTIKTTAQQDDDPLIAGEGAVVR